MKLLKVAGQLVCHIYLVFLVYLVESESTK